MKELVRCIIVSHRRAGKVLSHKRVANCWLCCEESQVPAYVAAHPEFEDRVMPHPDGLDLLETRQWLVDNAPENRFEIDDDALGIYRIYRRPGSWKKAMMSRDLAYELIQSTAYLTKELGAFLFGFSSHAHPLTYNGLRPFGFGGYTPGGAVGSLDGLKFHYPTAKEDPDHASAMGLDYWTCLINAQNHRYAFYDRRFAFGFAGTYVSAGGTAVERGKRFGPDGDDPEVAATKFLQRMFGTDVIKSVVDEAGTSLTKHKRNAGRRRLEMPYKV